MIVSKSKLSGSPIGSPALPVLNKLLNGIHRDILLEAKWFNDLTCLNQHITLNHALVRILSIPLFAHWHAHDLIKLFGTAVLIGQVLHPVLLREFLITFFCLVDLDTSQLCILTRLLDLVYLFLSD